MKKTAIITNIEEWKNAFNDDRHWKPGRSAYSLAEFMLSKQRNGDQVIKEILDACTFHNFQKTNCYVETSVKFDKYPRPSQRDMVLIGTVNKSEKLFITVEAKVDEEFGGGKIKEAIERQKGNRNQNGNRAEELFKLIPNPKPEDYNLKYQLFHATAATLTKGLGDYGEDFQHSIMLVLVFKTSGYTEGNYDDKIGEKNRQDFINFMTAIGANKKAEMILRNDLCIRTWNIPEKKITFIYSEIDFPNEHKDS